MASSSETTLTDLVALSEKPGYTIKLVPARPDCDVRSLLPRARAGETGEHDKLYLVVVKYEPQVCDSATMTEIMDKKELNRIVKFDKFDLDVPTIKRLIKEHRGNLPIEHVVPRFATPDMLGTLMREVYTDAGNFVLSRHLINLKIDLNSIPMSTDRPIHLVCQEPGWVIAKELIESGVEIDVPDEKGFYPIHYARSSIVINALSTEGADINRQNYLGDTALHCVCKDVNSTRSDLNTINSLFRNGAKVNIENKAGLYPMEILCDMEPSNKIDSFIVELMHKGTTLRFDTCTHMRTLRAVEAVAKNNGGSRKITLLNKAMLLQTVFGVHNSLMPYEIRSRFIKAFTRMGISVNYADESDKKTALHLACQESNTEMVKLLLDLGADKTQRDADGKIPAFYAAQKGNIEIIRMLCL